MDRYASPDTSPLRSVGDNLKIDLFAIRHNIPTYLVERYIARLVTKEEFLDSITDYKRNL